jgi:hypothetical protein
VNRWREINGRTKPRERKAISIEHITNIPWGKKRWHVPELFGPKSPKDGVI